MVLRAELRLREREIVAHTTALTADSVFVRTDEQLAVGDKLTLSLSLRRLLAPLRLDAHVVSTEPGSGPGYFAGVNLGFAAPSPRDEQRLAMLLATEKARNGAGGEAIDSVSRILVVEDSALMRDVAMLGANRFSSERAMQVKVATADSAETALKLLDEQSYQLALVDLYLPGAMNGADLVRAMRAHERHADVAVIGFSMGGTTAREEFLAAGADLFLDKPVMVTDLFATVERLAIMNAKDRS